jgi:ABC-type bacteriocin/lantibiotic exporter with double-glycine peptidase domain
LLDEATSALDIATEEKVLKNLKKLDGVTIIMITHKEKALEICDNHLVVKDKKFEIIK